MTTGIQVRKATTEDASAIATIHVASWQATYRGHMEDTFLDSLSVDTRTDRWRRTLMTVDGRTAVHVAERDGDIVGFCSTGPTHDTVMPTNTGELYTIYVNPEKTRSGIGTALIGRAEAAMRDAGYDAATLWVLRDNASARAFYERSGWTFDGTEKQEEIAGQSITEVRYNKRLA